MGNARRAQQQRAQTDDYVGGTELLLRAACALTACLHAPRSSLDLDRAFISK